MRFPCPPQGLLRRLVQCFNEMKGGVSIPELAAPNLGKTSSFFLNHMGKDYQTEGTSSNASSGGQNIRAGPSKSLFMEMIAQCGLPQEVTGD